MKKILFAIMAGLIPALATIHLSYGQASQNVAFTNPGNKADANLNAASANTTNFAKPGAAAAKALKHFAREYNAPDAKWEQGINCIVADYNHDGLNEKIYYDKKGNWSASVKTYGEDKMPKDIRAAVKRIYFDYTIKNVHEIVNGEATKESPVYLVTLEDDKEIKQVTVHEGEVKAYAEFSKN